MPALHTLWRRLSGLRKKLQVQSTWARSGPTRGARTLRLYPSVGVVGAGATNTDTGPHLATGQRRERCAGESTSPPARPCRCANTPFCSRNIAAFSSFSLPVTQEPTPGGFFRFLRQVLARYLATCVARTSNGQPRTEFCRAANPGAAMTGGICSGGHGRSRRRDGSHSRLRRGDGSSVKVTGPGPGPSASVREYKPRPYRCRVARATGTTWAILGLETLALAAVSITAGPREHAGWRVLRGRGCRWTAASGCVVGWGRRRPPEICRRPGGWAASLAVQCGAGAAQCRRRVSRVWCCAARQTWKESRMGMAGWRVPSRRRRRQCRGW